jgi:DNA-binding MarR family transcriptional regulator
MRFNVVLLVRNLPDISLAQKGFLLILESYMGRNEVCWHSQTTMAREMGITRRNLQHNIKKLSELEYIIVTPAPKHSRYITNRYEINVEKMRSVVSTLLNNNSVIDIKLYREKKVNV